MWFLDVFRLAGASALGQSRFRPAHFVAQTPLVARQDCLAPVNEIIRENCKTGNPATEWDINGAGSSLTLGLVSLETRSYRAKLTQETDTTTYTVYDRICT